uniref:Lipocalin/cytosolic fatty-acid binding domain-containing protein n=1 Tax=Amblyomma maculatum TaxID=34609 RepID=G3MQ51_AMBMU
MKAFNLVFFLALIYSGFCSKPTKDQLHQILNTKSRIWTPLRSYERSTEGKKHSCIYALKKSLSGDDYEFDQYFKPGTGPWQSHHLFGELSQTEDGATLTVKQNKSSPGIPYTLVYWNFEKNCGILTFGPESGKQCELHIKEDDLLASPTDVYCEREYEQYCPGARKYTTYSADCLPQATN